MQWVLRWNLLMGRIQKGSDRMNNASADSIDLSNVIYGSDKINAACSPGDIDDCSPDRGGEW